jgi:hypothetical protein
MSGWFERCLVCLLALDVLCQQINWPFCASRLIGSFNETVVAILRCMCRLGGGIVIVEYQVCISLINAVYLQSMHGLHRSGVDLGK